MRAWIKGTNSDFRAAQYQQFCRDGAESSIILFSLVPILTLGLGIVCCCCHRGNGIKGNKGVCDELDDKKKRKTKKSLTRSPSSLNSSVRRADGDKGDNSFAHSASMQKAQAKRLEAAIAAKIMTPVYQAETEQAFVTAASTARAEFEMEMPSAPAA